MYSNIQLIGPLITIFSEKYFSNNIGFKQALLNFFNPIIDQGEIITDGYFIFKLNWNIVFEYLHYAFNGRQFGDLIDNNIFSVDLARKNDENFPGYIDRMVDYFSDKVNTTLVTVNAEIRTLKWPLIIDAMIRHEPHIEYLWDKILYKKIFGLIKSISETKDKSNIILQCESMQIAFKLNTYFQIFSQALRMELENVNTVGDAFTLQLSKKLWDKFSYIQRESTENIGNQYVVKVIRASTNNTSDFLLDGLFPDENDPHYQDIRPALRKKFIFNENGTFKRKDKKPMYSEEEKQGFSQIQSLTFINQTATTEVVDFYPDKDFPKVGVMIHMKDTLPKCFLVNDGVGGTVNRPFEANNLEEATKQREKYISNTKINYFGISRKEQFIDEISKINKVNEDMARARWDYKDSKVNIYLDNFRSRIYVQHFAEKIRQCLEKSLEKTKDALPEDYQVPILFYLPKDEIRHLAYYTEELQQIDKIEAKRQYHTQSVRSANYNNKCYEFLLALDEGDVYRALIENVEGYPLLITMIEQGYLSIATDLFFKCTDQHKKEIIEHLRKAKCVKSDHVLPAVKGGYIKLAQELMCGWRPKDDSFWLPCFEREANPKVVKLIGYESTLKMLAKGGKWERIHRIIEKIGTLEQHDQCKGFYGKLLHDAIAEKQKPVVSLLLRKGADITYKNNNLTPIAFAANEKRWDYVALFPKYQASDNADAANFSYALKDVISEMNKSEEKIPLVKKLMAQGANINSPEKNKCTPLHFSVKNNDIEITSLLLEKEADVNAVSSQNISPIMLAVYYGYLDIVNLLLKSDTNLNIQFQFTDDKNFKVGDTVLHLAVRAGELKLRIVMALLERRDIDINAVNEDGDTALHIAAERENEEIIWAILKRHDVNIDVVNKAGVPALHAVAHVEGILST